MLALDQGTTSSRALLFNREGRIVSIAQQELHQITPREGWVEQDPRQIWSTQLQVSREVLTQAGASPQDLAGVGITNQRETTVVWEKDSGQPVYNAIVWQCRRTAPLCQDLKKAGYQDKIQKKTGLLLDPYFSGTKIRWILDEVPGAREKAQEGELLFGTVDTWLLWNLTGGRVHATDVTNASRTMLMNIHTGTWDEEILSLLEIPSSLLPEIRMSKGFFGESDASIWGRPLPVSGIAGDQQASLFGHQALTPGKGKNTYGTGCFLLMNIGHVPRISLNGLLLTVAWGWEGKLTYALEGSIFMAGAVVQWLRDDLQLIRSAEETEALAREVEDTAGVYLIPAFQGLGTPWWDSHARGALWGLTRAAKRPHIVRAALESMAYRSRDVLEVMTRDSGTPMEELRVDGGASRNDFLLQFQSDILGIPVQRPDSVEATARGAAYLAGWDRGFWSGPEELASLEAGAKTFHPGMEEEKRRRLYAGWQSAVSRCLSGENA